MNKASGRSAASVANAELISVMVLALRSRISNPIALAAAAMLARAGLSLAVVVARRWLCRRRDRIAADDRIVQSPLRPLPESLLGTVPTGVLIVLYTK
jgi:hypothetical protein